MKYTDRYVFFFTNSDVFSNWYIAPFEIQGQRFNCVEQYMMYQKAILFKDQVIAKKILNTTEPKEQKALGKMVAGFNNAEWIKHRVDIVTDGAVAKFKQNARLSKDLLATGNRIIVEASPYDCIWGVGLDKNHPDIENPEKWRGLNLAGAALMKARTQLEKENSSMSNQVKDNPFVLPVEEYKRDIQFLKQYADDQARHLSIMTNRPYEECLTFVKQQLSPTGEYPFKDPTIHFLERQENGDRAISESTLTQYMNEVSKEEHLLAPTFTVYNSAAKKPSLLSKYITGNVKLRNAAKKLMYAAMAAKDEFMELVKYVEQKMKKLANNAISGSHLSPSTPIFNKTGHSTLTSNCRCTSGYGNANNEKFLCGNRHYWCFDVTYSNIISIVNNTNYVQFEAVMTKYKLHYPSTDEVMQAIKYSTDLYWNSKSDTAKLQRLVEKLSPLQKAAFLYTGDLYHLMQYNQTLIRTFITKLSRRVHELHPNPKAVYDSAPEDHRFLAFSICKNETKGMALEQLVNSPNYPYVASTLENIGNVLQEYRDLIRGFWVTENVPASLAVFPESIRRSAVTSDTDSTIFTVKDWMIWYNNGTIEFGQQFDAVGVTMIFLASQAITHVLAKMSSNFGIAKDNLFKIAMKNEYYFPVFIPTQLGKHYYAYKEIQEGLVFEKFKKEIKGVHLKNSNAPKFINEEAVKLMEYVMDTVLAGKQISLTYILKWVGDLERGIYKSIASGSYDYFRRIQVKESSSYKQGEDASIYMQYTLWRDVFAPKYGEVVAPPYMCLKITTEIDTAGDNKLWLEKMEDRALAKRMEEWLKKNNKKYVKMFVIPEQIIASNGIPKEILEVVGARQIVVDTMKTFYIILDSLGLFMMNKKATKLVSDMY